MVERSLHSIGKHTGVINKLMEEVMSKWKSIETAPKDGTKFIALIDGIPYAAMYVMNNGNANLQWWMHIDRAEGESYYKSTDINGNEVRTMIKAKDKYDYKPSCLGYKLGMEVNPTHWIDLPEIPK